MLSVFRNRLFVAVVSGHFVVDVLNSTGPVLMAVLAVGPAVGGRLFDAGGSLGMLPLCAMALVPAGLLLAAPAAPPVPFEARRDTGAPVRVAGAILAAFIALVALRSSIQAAYMAFL